MNIGLHITIDDSYTRGIARGIIKYAKKDTNWNLLGTDWMFSPQSKGRLDGVISRIEIREQADCLAQLNVPIVDVAGAWPQTGFFEVHNDDFATGTEAGRYLLSLGHTYFAWAGVTKVDWSRYRYEGFTNTLASNAVFTGSPIFEQPLQWWEKLDEGLEPLCKWLTSLKKPIALFAANDTVGLKITRICTACAILVPEDIAILGVDNEDILCELANPSLSSIRINCELMGYRAAKLLDALIHKGSKGLRNQVIAHLDIEERESTRIIIAQDPLVEQALNFIKNRAHNGLRVEDMLHEIPASRRNLEKRFFAEMGRTLHDEIILTKINYSKKKLRESNAPLDVIATESGFGSLQRFHSQFKKHEGTTPGRWRSRIGK